jgi:hypothetical protein
VHRCELEHDIALAEFEHEAALSKVAKTSWLAKCDMPELENEIPVVEATEGPWFETLRLRKEAAVVEIKAMLSQLQRWAKVAIEMARTKPALICLGWLRPHSQRCHYRYAKHDLGHRVAP